ncbi:hypothetical protein HK101_007936 [Irineochytrium annulatum]|nr:hypothetical protein HK101_007936 [Irineochytrium annulatum]
MASVDGHDGPGVPLPPQLHAPASDGGASDEADLHSRPQHGHHFSASPTSHRSSNKGKAPMFSSAATRASSSSSSLPGAGTTPPRPASALSTSSASSNASVAVSVSTSVQSYGGNTAAGGTGGLVGHVPSSTAASATSSSSHPSSPSLTPSLALPPQPTSLPQQQQHQQQQQPGQQILSQQQQQQNVSSRAFLPFHLDSRFRRSFLSVGSGAGSGSGTGVGGYSSTTPYGAGMSHASSTTSSSAFAGFAFDDDRSDAATIGTSVAGNDPWDDFMDGEEEEELGGPSGFEAVKRWTLRVNSAGGGGATVGSAGASATAVASSSSSAGRVLLPLPEDEINVERPTRSPSPPAAIDPDVLASLVSTLEDGEAEMVMEFVSAFDGAIGADAVYERIRDVQGMREGGGGGGVTGGGGVAVGHNEWQWEDVESRGTGRASEDVGSGISGIISESVEVGVGPGPAGIISLESSVGANEDAATALAGSGRRLAAPKPTRGNHLRVMSDENDTWRQDTEVGEDSAEGSEWIVLDEGEEPHAASATSPSTAGGFPGPIRQPTLRSLPKRALVSILLHSGNVNLLKTCRRLSRVPIPEVGSHLARMVVSLCPASILNDEAVLLPRCARAACLNRSAMTLPSLAVLLGSSFTPTADTLGAVVEIAARGRRWNTVKGALSLAKTVAGGLGVGGFVRMAMLKGDLDAQRMRRHFVPRDEDTEGSAETKGVVGGLHLSLAANLIANHGEWLDVEFFKDLVEEEGVDFPEEVISHAAASYGLTPQVVDYLRGRLDELDMTASINARFAKMGLA